MSPGFRVWQTNPGIPVEITEDLKDGEVWLDSTRKSSLRRDGIQLTASFFERGVVVIATAHPHQNEYYINFQIRIPTVEFSGRTKGFLGNLDNNPTNDFYRRGSTTPLSNSISEKQLLEHLITCMYTCIHACTCVRIIILWNFQGKCFRKRVFSFIPELREDANVKHMTNIKILTLFHYFAMN